MPYAAESLAATAAREARKIWPFLGGLGLVGYAVSSVTAGITEEVRAPAARASGGSVFVRAALPLPAGRLRAAWRSRAGGMLCAGVRLA